MDNESKESTEPEIPSNIRIIRGPLPRGSLAKRLGHDPNSALAKENARKIRALLANRSGERRLQSTDCNMTASHPREPHTSVETLIRFIANCPEQLPRTERLQARIEIGVGFHGKWYRSQREHWLGWLAAKRIEAELKGEDPASLKARAVWQRLKCMPMMFWLAEAVGLNSTLLDQVEEAASTAAEENGKDCAMHGKVIRGYLPWAEMESAILAAKPTDTDKACQAAQEAFERLAGELSRYRKLKRDYEAR